MKRAKFYSWNIWKANHYVFVAYLHAALVSPFRRRSSAPKAFSIRKLSARCATSDRPQITDLPHVNQRTCIAHVLRHFDVTLLHGGPCCLANRPTTGKTCIRAGHQLSYGRDHSREAKQAVDTSWKPSGGVFWNHVLYIGIVNLLRR